jgi:hypothetical protein
MKYSSPFPMNQQLQDFARATIKEGLAKLPLGWQNKFRLMHGEVDEMPPEKLDWAMTQVANSLRKYEKWVLEFCPRI